MCLVIKYITVKIHTMYFSFYKKMMKLRDALLFFCLINRLRRIEHVYVIFRSIPEY